MFKNHLYNHLEKSPPAIRPHAAGEFPQIKGPTRRKAPRDQESPPKGPTRKGRVGRAHTVGNAPKEPTGRNILHS